MFRQIREIKLAIIVIICHKYQVKDVPNIFNRYSNSADFVRRFFKLRCLEIARRVE